LSAPPVFPLTMRILHILDHSIPTHSGYTFRTLAILREQRELGWNTFHLTGERHPDPAGARERVDGWHFYRTRPATGWMTRYPVICEIARMRELQRRIEQVAREVEPDLLHAHSPVLNALPSLRAGRKLGLPVVYEVRAFWEDAAVNHGTSREGHLRYRLTRGLETYALQHADAVTTICDGLRNEMVQRGISRERVTVIPNAVDIEKFSLSAAADPQLKRSLLLEGHKVIGFIGSFYAYEGLALLLQAVPLLLRRVPKLKVLLVGGGPQESELRTLAARLGLHDEIRFAGRVPHDEVERYYDLIDVLAYPRLSMRLTDLVTPLKPLEAMARGRLLVASDVGGHRELIQDGKTGVLFTAGSAEALAAQVAALLEQPDRWPALQANARRFVETQRTWKHSVARYERVYESCLRLRPGHERGTRATSNV